MPLSLLLRAWLLVASACDAHACSVFGVVVDRALVSFERGY
jgi:hypothetical protein